MEKVVIKRCEDYDAAKLEEILKKGMQELDIPLQGNTMIKINEVAAYPKQKIFKYASTPPEFLDAAISALKSFHAKSLYLGGKSGITIPTRFVLKMGGHWKVLKKHKLRAYCFDEHPEVEVELKKGKVHRTLRIPQILTETDTIVSLPKFKANPFTTITAAIKMNMGMLDDKERLKHHHYSLDEKIVDILEVANPSFIAVDCIIAGENNMLEPDPYHIGAVVMGTNAVAVDSILCSMIGIDPMDIKHIRIAHERGYGPVRMEDIALSGDMGLGELKERAKDFKTNSQTIDKLESNIRFYVGENENGYCFGGCPGAFKEAFHIIKGLQPHIATEVRPMHIVFGDYEGPIIAKDNEPIFLMGKCASLKGAINGNNVEIDSRMSHGKLRKITHYCKIKKIHKCPLSVADNILVLSLHGKTANPYLDKDAIIPFAYNFLASRILRVFNRYAK